jgi:hypothetical protein
VVFLHGFLQIGYLLEGLAQFLLRLLQLSRELGGVQVAIGGCLAHSFKLVLELLYSAVALGYVFILALNGQLSLPQVFLKLLDLGLLVFHLGLEGSDLLVTLSAYFVDLNFGISLLDFLGFFDGCPQRLRCLSAERLPLLFGLLLEGVFAVHFLL